MAGLCSYTQDQHTRVCWARVFLLKLPPASYHLVVLKIHELVNCYNRLFKGIGIKTQGNSMMMFKVAQGKKVHLLKTYAKSSILTQSSAREGLKKVMPPTLYEIPAR